MFKYSMNSEMNLAEAHVDLQKLFKRVIQKVDHSITEGMRGRDKQNELYNKGLSKVRYPDSKHNRIPSEAVDAWPCIDGKTVFSASQCYFFAGYVMAIAEEMFNAGEISHKIRWGGDWDCDGNVLDNKFQDLGHFEIIK